MLKVLAGVKIAQDTDTNDVYLVDCCGASMCLSGMTIYELTYDGVAKAIKRGDDTLTFEQVVAACLDKHLYVYLTYQNKLYIPACITNNTVFFDNTFNSVGVVTINRVFITSSNVVNDSSTVVETTSNRVTTIDATSTDSQYPTAKAVYDAIHTI